MRWSPGLRRLGRLVVGVALAASVAGCAVGDLLKTRESQKIVKEYARVSGTVSTQVPSSHWIIVYVAQVPCDDDWRELQKAVASGELGSDQEHLPPHLEALAERLAAKFTLAQHVVLQRPGSWLVALPPGCYAVGAFEDVNQDYTYDDEPASPASANPDRIFELAAGERKDGIDIVIPPDGRLARSYDIGKMIRAQTFRHHDQQALVSLDAVSVEGEVVDLRDARFGEENGKLGYWDVFAFLVKVGPGIYFLEPYDPDKIPVLFVHGAEGYPQEFEVLIDSLDRERYQPWFFFYPSGAYLESVADFLSQIALRLQLRYGFDRMVVVAHSMGGLVSRAFILRHHERVRQDPVKLFVSISTPWGGVSSARQGVERSPIVVPSWHDVATDSEFLRGIFFQDPETQKIRRHLPPGVSDYLIFGVEDETISLPSAVRWEAVRDAQQRWPLPYDHTKILRSAEASTLLQEILKQEME